MRIDRWCPSVYLMSIIKRRERVYNGSRISDSKEKWFPSWPERPYETASFIFQKNLLAFVLLNYFTTGILREL